MQTPASLLPFRGTILRGSAVPPRVIGGAEPPLPTVSTCSDCSSVAFAGSHPPGLTLTSTHCPSQGSVPGGLPAPSRSASLLAGPGKGARWAGSRAWFAKSRVHGAQSRVQVPSRVPGLPGCVPGLLGRVSGLLSCVSGLLSLMSGVPSHVSGCPVACLGCLVACPGCPVACLVLSTGEQLELVFSPPLDPHPESSLGPWPAACG